MAQKVSLLLMAIVLGLAPLLTGAVAPRGQVAGRYALELDGVVVGWVDEAEGGNAVAEVVTEQPGGDGRQKKHIGKVKYEEITLTAGAGMAEPFYRWIQDSVSHQSTRKSGAIIAVSHDAKEVSRLSFNNAEIAEIGLPALDAGSKDAATITVKLKPDWTRRSTDRSGQSVKLPASRPQKRWLTSNFRLKIDGLEDATIQANKIDALVIKQKVAETPVGDRRDYGKEPAALEIPDLIITLADSHAAPLYDWHEEFVIKGNAADTNEKGGTLEYLAPDMKEVLFTLRFHNLGIFRIAPDKTEAAGENSRRVKAEMYCEQIGFGFLSSQPPR